MKTNLIMMNSTMLRRREKSTNVLIRTRNTMPRTCALTVITEEEGQRRHGTVPILTSFTTQKDSARIAICLGITKKEKFRKLKKIKFH